MKRSMVLLLAVLVVGLLPSAAFAQDDDEDCRPGPYGSLICVAEEDPDDDDDERPDEEDGQVQEETPCSTIIVTGDSWGPGTNVFIDREFEDSDCPAPGNSGAPNAGGNVPDEDDDEDDDAEQGDDEFASTTPVERTPDGREQVRTREDGTFTARLQVPSTAEAGDYAITFRGTDAAGEERQEVQTYEVRELRASPAVSESGRGTATTALALAAILGAVLVALGFGGPNLLKRR